MKKMKVLSLETEFKTPLYINKSSNRRNLIPTTITTRTGRVVKKTVGLGIEG